MKHTGSGNNSLFDILLYAACWLLLLLSLYQVYASLSLQFSAGEHDYYRFLSADTLVFAALYRDVFVDGFNWSGWHISHAPQYLQMALFFTLRFISGDFLTAHLWYALVLPLVMTLGFEYLGSTLFRPMPLRFRALIVLTAGVICLLFASGIAYELKTYFWVCRHGGATTVWPFALGLLLRCLGQWRIRTTVALAVLVAVTCFADPIFIAIFVLPALTTVVLAHWFSVPKKVWIPLAAILALSTGLGMAVSNLISRHRSGGQHLELHLGQVLRSGVLLLKGFFDFHDGHIAYHLLFVAWLVVAVVLLALYLRFRRRNPTDDSKLLFHLFLLNGLVMSLVMSGSVVVTGNATRTGFLRYLVSCDILAVFGLTFYCIAFGRQLNEIFSRFMAAMAVAGFVVYLGVGWVSPPEKSLLDYYPQLTRCIDQNAEAYSLRYGISEYWLAKYNSMFSRQGVRVYQVKKNLRPRYTINNIDWYFGLKSANRHQNPVYNFVIIGGRKPRQALSPIVVREKFGLPQHTLTCGRFEIWVYGEPFDQQLKEWFLTESKVRHWREQNHALGVSPTPK